MLPIALKVSIKVGTTDALRRPIDS
jgi:hypothetical protein